jgi:hypothetical protein
MSKSDPSLTVAINQKTGDFAIINLAVDPKFGFQRGWGPLVHVPRSQMQKEGLSIVLDNLAGFHDRNGDDGGELDGDPVKQRKFCKLHKEISISIRGKNSLVLSPFRRNSRGGGASEYEDVITLPFPYTNDQFIEALQLAETRAQ